MNSKVALVIIFNHRYDKNIPLLRKIYSDRFSIIRFIVPFYEGKDDDVYTVYENSFEFQGYIAQSYDKLKELECQHYVFIGDDLILNPTINENNILSSLRLNKSDSYIESVTPLKYMKWHYHRFFNASKAFLGEGVNFDSELPSYESAYKRVAEYGFGNIDINKDMKKIIPDVNGIRGKIKVFLDRTVHPVTVKYPLFTGYSDFFVIPKEKLYDFSRLCGVFSAMRLFVEIAIPTAMVLVNHKKNLKMQQDVEVITKKMWCVSDFVMHFEKKCNYRIENMDENWPINYLYLHPVKLSRWE